MVSVNKLLQDESYTPHPANRKAWFLGLRHVPQQAMVQSMLETCRYGCTLPVAAPAARNLDQGEFVCAAFTQGERLAKKSAMIELGAVSQSASD